MPYEMIKHGTGWAVKNKENGKVHSKHTTRQMAMAQIRLLRGVDHGWKPKK